MQHLSLLAFPLLWTTGCRAICEKPSTNPICLSPCDGFTTCIPCLAGTNCHWCSVTADFGSGHGWCAETESRTQLEICNISTYRGPNQLLISNDRAFWYNSSCPAENECENGHHDCNAATERCVDKEIGFECKCKNGYTKKNGVCVSVCANGCVNGDCVEPDVCHCHFGYVGPTCAWACNCGGHSTCPGPQELDTCLKCHNHTKGEHCELCETGYIKLGNSCVSCREYCHNHSDTCISAQTNSLMLGSVTAPPGMGTSLIPFDGGRRQNSLAICAKCMDFTKGLQCEYCLSGYFRPPKSPPEMSCMKCDCNGHGVDNFCFPHNGGGCECRNNTMTLGCKDDECWMVQCAACKDGFRGTPVGGRQCFREVNEADQDICLVPEDCSRFKPSRRLRPFEMSFFILSPEFSNVDLRIIIDVGVGKLDAFVAVTDVFVANYDPAARCHTLSWKTSGEILDDSSKRSYKENADDDDPCPPGGSSSWDSVKITDASDDLASYVTFNSPSSILIVQNIENRAIIVAPASAFDLKSTRFHLVLRARNSSSTGAWGNLLYTQDQAHFDLFIFFAVFFAAFFLALSVILVLWRLKMMHVEHRHDRAQTIELLKMARRPFISFSALWKDGEVGECSKYLDDDTIDPWPFCFQNLRKKPVTVATLLVRMPGGSRAPVKLGFATALLLTAPAVKNTKSDTPAGDAATDGTKKRSGKRYLLSSNRHRVQPC